ncbi:MULTISPECIES: hypothetical protein [Microbacterium]|uniref:hypothetical protein n=1 Tax=Microbacterium TaxID=33882 RepID=UPI002785B9B3|nr:MULTISPECIES: hypothetical protein [Microbacterium]MDQ1074260.1 hypothetical protein [Microbacterium sp. SORGH_AS_0969]MDQ1114487.1 hypothetical protein [Microbacterium testaceum]
MSEASPPTRRARKAVADETTPSIPVEPDAAVDSGAEEGRLATAQLEMAAFGDHVIPYVPPAPRPPPSLAPWALLLAIASLASSFFWGWLLPLSAVAAIVATMSLRRAHDGRRAATWALVLSLLSAVFSAGWLVWGFSQLAA